MVKNILEGSKFSMDKMISSLRLTRKQDELDIYFKFMQKNLIVKKNMMYLTNAYRWDFGASIVNAYYDPETNQICKTFSFRIFSCTIIS